MASSKNIEQSEVPAKVWQIEALAEKIDGLSKSQDDTTKQTLKDRD